MSLAEDMGLAEDDLEDLVSDEVAEDEQEVEEQEVQDPQDDEKGEVKEEVEEEVDEEAGEEEEAEVVADDKKTFNESFVPRLDVAYKDIEAAQRVISTKQAEISALREQYRDGDIDEDSYEDKVSLLNNELTEARIDYRVMSETQKNNQAIQEQAWKDAQDRFFVSNDFYNDPDSRQYKVLNTFVIDIANQNPQRSGAWVLEQAKEEADAIFNPAKQEAVRSKEFKTKGKQLGSKAPEVVDLGTIPESEGQEDSDRFAYIDALMDKDPVAAQRELDKLSDSDMEAYLS